MTDDARGGIRGRLAALYDVFVDWPGRLGREMPGLLRWLRAADARRVLDVGCGTGRHVGALLAEGFDAFGADLSEDMLAQAREHTGAPERFFAWRMGEDPPAALRAQAPFDAVVSLGNAWPQVLATREVDAALAAFRALLRPGGVAVLGLKAVAVRADDGNPYMPLLKRTHEGQPLFFVRFVDFDVAPLDDGSRVCEFHMVVVGPDEDTLVHRSSRCRVWSPETLAAAFAGAGFRVVVVSGRLGDADVEPRTEDVFVRAFAPGA